MENTEIPYLTVQFDRRAALVDAGQVQAIQQMVRQAEVTDLLVFAHGWNNNIATAEARYARFLGHVRTLLDGELSGAFADRKLGAIGIVWPSMRYTDPAQIPGGAASMDLRPMLEEELAAAQQLFQGMPDSPLPAILTQVQENLAVLEDRGSLRDALAQAVAAQLKTSATNHQERPIPQRYLGSGRVESRLATEIRGVGTVPAAVVTGAGHAAGTMFNGPLQIVRNLLNLTTFYEMKDRAGQIGEMGVRGLLRELRAASPGLRLHLIGHSFGGRLVSAVARGSDGDARLDIDSLHLLQAAFSHNGFGSAIGQTPEGYFRPVMTGQQVRGPTLITHTKNDRAVGLAYAVASALSGQNASAIGDNQDQYGAIGSNGALRADGVNLVLGNDTALAFERGRLYNLLADIIPNHSEVEQFGVARAVLSGISVT